MYQPLEAVGLDGHDLPLGGADQPCERVRHGQAASNDRPAMVAVIDETTDIVQRHRVHSTAIFADVRSLKTLTGHRTIRCRERQEAGAMCDRSGR